MTVGLHNLTYLALSGQRTFYIFFARTRLDGSEKASVPYRLVIQQLNAGLISTTCPRIGYKPLNPKILNSSARLARIFQVTRDNLQWLIPKFTPKLSIFASENVFLR